MQETTREKIINDKLNSKKGQRGFALFYLVIICLDILLLMYSNKTFAQGLIGGITIGLFFILMIEAWTISKEAD